MSEDSTKKTMFRLHLVIGVIVLLFGVVALAVLVEDSEGSHEQESTFVKESSFNGIDGSLTSFAFNLVASEYKSYMAEVGEQEPMDFDSWLFENAQRLPQTDAFNQRIQMRLRDDVDGFVLRSAGADKVIDTADDYINTYTL